MLKRKDQGFEIDSYTISYDISDESLKITIEDVEKGTVFAFEVKEMRKLSEVCLDIMEEIGNYYFISEVCLDKNTSN